MNDTNSIQSWRKDLAAKGKWNIGYYWSGFVYWIFILIVGVSLPLDTAKFLWLFGGFFIVPMAIPFSKLSGADAFPKDNPLADLSGLTHVFVTTLGFPMVLVPLIFYPQAQILMMAILYCIDFYVFSWVFQSRLFVVAGCIRVVGSCAIWFFLPEYRVSLLPAFVALTYLVIALSIPGQRKNWELRLNSASSA